MKNLENYTFINTQDGSTTLFSKDYNEACHSSFGARSETNVHYIEGCEIERICKNNKEISILEIGFGTGMGFEESLKTATVHNCFLKFTSLEIDQALKDYYLKQNKESPDNYKLNIIVENARKSIKELIQKKMKFDAIYQDAFSPKRNAILWTTQWFTDLLKVANDNCIMSTYSSSSSIRKSMLHAGWKLYEGKSFGAKRSSTRAKTKGITEPAILEKLSRSSATMLTDENYSQYKLES